MLNGDVLATVAVEIVLADESVGGTVADPLDLQGFGAANEGEDDLFAVQMEEPAFYSVQWTGGGGRIYGTMRRTGPPFRCPKVMTMSSSLLNSLR
jgi:hypothetical protein